MSRKAFACDWCGKTFTTKRRVETHKYENKIPCNLKCRICGVILNTKKAYKQHQKIQHAEERPEDEAFALIEKGPIPVDDLKLVAALVNRPLVGDEQIELTMEEAQQFMRNMKFYDEHGNEIVQEQELNLLVKNKITIRANNARRAISSNMMYGAVNTMSPNRDIEEATTEVMYEALSRSDPSLHNLCLGDVSRGTVRVRSRDAEDKPYWVVHKKLSGYSTVKDYSKVMFRVIFESGMDKLEPYYWEPEETESIAYYGDHDWSVVLFMRHGRLEVTRVRNHQLRPMPPDYEPPKQLLDMVNERKAEVLAKLDRFEMKDSKVEEILSNTRKHCLPDCQS